MATLEQIAQLAQVSRSTVSRVINNDPRVKDQTRARVLEVIDRLHFQPNLAARSLAGGRTHILGVVIPMTVSAVFNDPYFSILLQGISTACNLHDHAIMLWLSEPDYVRRTVRQVINNKLLDGLIIASTVIDEPLLSDIIESGLPFIVIGRQPLHPDVNYVDVDNVSGAHNMVAYLLQLGYRRIATITGPQNMISGADRLEGYCSALREWDVPVDNGLIVEGNYLEESGYAAMKRLLPRRPEAVFSASDLMAAGAIRAIREAGLRIPEDVSLASFDDMPSSRQSDPPLTTVRQPILRTGSMAAETLMSLSEGSLDIPQHIILPTELVIRASVKTPTK